MFLEFVCCFNVAKSSPRECRVPAGPVRWPSATGELLLYEPNVTWQFLKAVCGDELQLYLCWSEWVWSLGTLGCSEVRGKLTCLKRKTDLVIIKEDRAQGAALYC